MSTPVLTVENVTKRFGGLSALDGASMTFQAGKLHAVIGPNGAGKTTLFNVITGTLAPTSGRIRFLGTDITGWPVHRISRMGLARTLQIKSVFSGMTVRENLWIAAQSRDGVFKPFASARHCRRSNEKVDALCEELGLTPLAEQQAANLSYGDVALLEIGLALATEPKLLLLDEPICGMGPAETE
jgi:branched-chain amino acid transport system ATP-binding protein